jgi:hypothetical protein
MFLKLRAKGRGGNVSPENEDPDCFYTEGCILGKADFRHFSGFWVFWFHVLRILNLNELLLLAKTL